MGRSKIQYNRIEMDGHVFDSTTEYEYYRYLKYFKKELGIKEFILQPEFVLVEEYTVTCWKCDGEGKVYNEKTERWNKCRRKICNDGVITKEAVMYTADFQVFFEDGREYVLDVKGYRGQDKKFNLKKRLFEAKFGVELIMVLHTSKGWEWKT